MKRNNEQMKTAVAQMKYVLNYMLYYADILSSTQENFLIKCLFIFNTFIFSFYTFNTPVDSLKFKTK